MRTRTRATIEAKLAKPAKPVALAAGFFWLTAHCGSVSVERPRHLERYSHSAKVSDREPPVMLQCLVCSEYDQVFTKAVAIGALACSVPLSLTFP